MIELLTELATAWADDIIGLGLALLTTWGLTEPLKRAARYLHWDRRGNLMPWAIAVTVGLLAGFMFAPVDGQLDPVGHAVLCAAVAPAAYRLVIAYVRRRWPDIAAALTGGQR